MAININRYVEITSGVGGSSQVAGREYIARVFTTNELLPPQTYVEFSDADAVSDFFGSSSEEYDRALFYFNFISKSLVRPAKISFARFADVAVAPMVFGYNDPADAQALADYTGISDGSFKLTINGVQTAFTAIDFTGLLSLTAVASAIQAVVQAAGGANYATATVTWNSTTGNFIFTGGATGDLPISVEAGTVGTNIAGILKWTPQATFTDGVFSGGGAIWATGSAIETPVESLTASIAQSNNFGSFCFMPMTQLVQADVVNVATYNDSLNVMFEFQVAVSAANASAWAAAVANIGGVGLTLAPLSDEYPEMLPMAIQAATDYSALNSVQNYMFQQHDDLTASVTTDASADTYDAEFVNYYGQTQQAGQFIAFYQRGKLMGISTDPLDMNVYANEIWLKDAATVALMNLLLSSTQVPANSVGRNMLLTILQGVINLALRNGTISVNKPLTDIQKAYILTITGDPNAWYQVQNSGYWVDVQIVLSGSDYIATYTLIYSKDDVIRKVEGTDLLI